MMASAQVVETSVNTNNSPSQNYTTNPDDHSNHNIIDTDDGNKNTFKNNLRTIEPPIVQKLKNNEPRPKFTGSYNKGVWGLIVIRVRS